MFAKFLRKSLTLLVIYAVIIIGIFIIQFKNDSIITEKLGSLHLTLLESTADDNSTSLKNKFNVVFNGINFFGNDENPATATINGTERPIALTAWNKENPLKCELDFTNNIKVFFTLSDDSPLAYMMMEAQMPNNVQAVHIPYNFGVGTATISQTDSKIQVSNKKNTWELNAFRIEKNFITLSRREPSASYAYFDRSRSFIFEDALALENSSESLYLQNIENLKTNLINSYSQIQPETGTVSEQETVSFVAVMAERGKYNEALDAVPQSFKKSSVRTFLSAPYFNTLARVNEGLQAQLASYADSVQKAASSVAYDIFTVRFIADYMCMHPGSEAIKTLLSKTAESDFAECTVQQVTGILRVYNELAEKNPILAQLLAPAAPKCVEKIQSSCTLQETTVTIAEKGTFLSVIQAVLAGDAVLQYGNLIHNQTYVSGGRLILNSYLKDTDSFDLRVLGNLYPIVEHNNKFYPHFEILAFESGKAVWTWTCAENVSYENNNAGTITLNIDFPLSLTHYVILNGIAPFQQIFIYDMAFRTDYRFETYNSSGYVYQADSASLLLKSRHKSQLETVRLVYSQPTATEAE